MRPRKSIDNVEKQDDPIRPTNQPFQTMPAGATVIEAKPCLSAYTKLISAISNKNLNLKHKTKRRVFF